ncbi:MAG: pantetheine-phosphate adenylyltransferase [SAR324 cluster bacterium]|nr:pantetheine-phosphate adenylyltransferase [SAR324 cluster bacterium]
MIKKQIAIYPISANPPTWGHANILLRASSLFDHVYWAAAVNANKKYIFSAENRIQMMQEYVKHYQLKNISVESYQGATVRYAEKINAKVIIKGLRNMADFQGEIEQATGNRGINETIETVLMFAPPDLSVVSSSLVRELALLGENIEAYVLKEVAAMVSDFIAEYNLKLPEN